MSLASCELQEVASVALGFKSLQNQFFYVPKKAVESFEIEKRYLFPIFRLKDLKASEFIQAGKPSLRLFLCKLMEGDIRGTGALKYIRTMAGRPAASKKQSRGHQTIEQVLRAQGGGLWYAPKAHPHRSHIWIRKAIDGVYAPFLFTAPVVMDQRCNSVKPRDDLEWDALAAVLSSSLFALSVESYGAASMGAGALEVATKKLREIRVPDIRLLTKPERKALVTMAGLVWENEKPVDWRTSSTPGPYLRELDKWLLKGMGKTLPVDKVYSDLVETCRARLSIAADKEVAAKRAVRHDIDSVAKGIVEGIQPLLEGKLFPEAFLASAGPTEHIDLRSHPTLEISTTPFMTESTLTIRDGRDGRVILDEVRPRDIVHVIVRALLMGRRVFDAPLEAPAAADALTQWFTWFPSLLQKLEEGCRSSALGTRFEDQLHAAVLKQLGLHAALKQPEVFGQFILS